MRFLFLLFLFLGTPLLADREPEVEVLQQLVLTTRKNLENQEKILKFMQAYFSARQAYLADPDNGKLATTLVRKATLLQKLLDQEHLNHLFDADFLTEIAFYNQVGKYQTRDHE